MKDIVKKAGPNAKLRLRGKGSGFVEHSTQKESEEALQLCISCTEAHGYHVAVQCVDALLRSVYADYDKWCADRGLPDRAPALRMRERRGTDGGGASAPSAQKGKRRKARAGGAEPRAAPGEDKGEPPAGAPSVAEIEELIDQRNEARKAGDYSKADRIRNDLQAKKVVLSDEKGASGSAGSVTTWRYWSE